LTFDPRAGNSRKPDERQLEQVLAEIRALADDFELGIIDRARPDGKRWSITAAQLMAKAKAPTPSNGTGGGTVHYAADGSRPGPTPARALMVSEERKAWDSWLTEVWTGVLALRRANDILAKATPEHQRPDRPDLDACRICSRPGKPEPIYRAERCRWCYDFWLDWKLDVPEPILKLRRHGKRITENDIRTVIEEELAS
jgi:hypothetical protein